MTSEQLTALAIAVGAFVITVLASSIPALARLRVLFPGWRFFHRAVHTPRLYVREGTGPWKPLDELAGPRDRGSVLFAPHANLVLAYQVAVENLVSELGDIELDGAVPSDGIERDPRVTTLPAYRIVARIAAAHARGPHQWKITLPDETSPYIVSENTA